jgi:hypothetical protein
LVLGALVKFLLHNQEEIMAAAPYSAVLHLLAVAVADLMVITHTERDRMVALEAEREWEATPLRAVVVLSVKEWTVLPQLQAFHVEAEVVHLQLAQLTLMGMVDREWHLQLQVLPF